MRAVFAICLCLSANAANAQMQASLGVRAAAEEGFVLAGLLLEARFASWSGEMVAASGSDGGSRREHFQLELRRPVGERLHLIGGTRTTRITSPSLEAESLFAGFRAERRHERGAVYSSARLLRALGADHGQGYALEAGLLARLPERFTMSRGPEPGRFEAILSAEYEKLRAAGDELRSRRVALTIRYTISR